MREYYIEGPNQLDCINTQEKALTLALKILPGGTQAAYKALKEGSEVDVVLATVSDLGMILTLGGSKAIQAGRAALMAGDTAGHATKGLGVSLTITSMHLQGTGIVFNAAEAIRDGAKGELLSSAEHTGQLVLNVVVLRSGVKRLVPELQLVTPPKFRSDLESHLTERDSTVARSKGIGGAHSLDVFDKAASTDGIKITKRTPHPTLPGVEKIKYQIPALDLKGKPTGLFKAKPFEKTVYDPKKISNAEMIQWGKEAAKDAASRGALTREWTGKAKNGVKFRGYLDDAGEVRSFFPDF